jgi:hypothetical protein
MKILLRDYETILSEHSFIRREAGFRMPADRPRTEFLSQFLGLNCSQFFGSFAPTDGKHISAAWQQGQY